MLLLLFLVGSDDTVKVGLENVIDENGEVEKAEEPSIQ